MTIHLSAKIHPSSDVETGAILGRNVTIGPFCIIGKHVQLEDNVCVKSHAVITGDTSIGKNTTVFPHACIGEIPQDLKFKGEKSSLVIGHNNCIRECVTINTGTQGGDGITRIGNHCLLMCYAHIAHDVQIGDRVVVVSYSGISGHCTIDDDAIIGGLTFVHQFVHIGKGAIIGAKAKVRNDVIPYGNVSTPETELKGINVVGLTRKGIKRSEIADLQRVYTTLRENKKTLKASAAKMLNEHDPNNKYVHEVLSFIANSEKRTLLLPR